MFSRAAPRLLEELAPSGEIGLCVEQLEVLTVGEAIRPLILDAADSARIKRDAINAGMRTLRQSALKKLAEGVTSFEEIVRVTSV